MVKAVGELIRAANAAVEVRSVDEAHELLGREDVVFVDVREPAELKQGKVPGAVHVPRGLLEFAADPESPMHKEALSGDRRLVVYCASGGRSALAAKTLKDMGFARVITMQGGFTGWKDAGHEIEQDA